MIYAILLAAGESKRMGALKQILPFGKSTVIETIIDSLWESDIEKVRVVLGYRSEEISGVIGNREVDIVINKNYKNGMLSSIKCGISSLPEDAEAFLLCLVDQPAIMASDINKLIKAYRKSGKGIIIPAYNGKRGHPIIFDRKYIDDIINLKEDGDGLREVVWKNSHDVLEIEVENEAVIKDMDNIEEYREIVKITKCKSQNEK